MGMLFNTDETLTMNRWVHHQFRTLWPNFIASVASKGVWVPFFRALGTGGPGSTYAAVSGTANGVALDLNGTAAGIPAHDGNWQAWLILLDRAGISTKIGGHIADAINNSARYSGVEFHLVPDRAITESQLDFPNDAGKTTFTSVIVINTVTHDGVGP
jgi:hypothetical protein